MRLSKLLRATSAAVVYLYRGFVVGEEPELFPDNALNVAQLPIAPQWYWDLTAFHLQEMARLPLPPSKNQSGRMSVLMTVAQRLIVRERNHLDLGRK